MKIRWEAFIPGQGWIGLVADRIEDAQAVARIMRTRQLRSFGDQGDLDPVTIRARPPEKVAETF